MRRLLSALLLTALVAPGAAAGPANPLAPVIEVKGHGPTSATFTIDGTVSFDLDRAVVVGSGRYAGVVFMSASGAELGAVVSIPELDSPVQLGGLPQSWTLGSSVVTLKPGHYRVYLLADGDAVVLLPLTSGSGFTVTTTTPVKETFYAATRDVPTGPASVALPRPVATRTTTITMVLGQFARAVTAEKVTLRACLTRRGTPCGTRQSQTVVMSAPTTSANLLRCGLMVAASGLPKSPVDARADLSVASSYGGTFGSAVVQFDRV